MAAVANCPLLRNWIPPSSLNWNHHHQFLPSIVDGLRHGSLVVREVVEVVAAAADGPTRPAVDVVGAHAGPLQERDRERDQA